MSERRRDFDWSLVTPFRRRVYEALLQVPRGRVTTYGLLGKAIGCCSPQAIGQALRNNPFAPEVPCHRVISSTLEIGGFAGCTEGAEIARKLELLQSEGVCFADGKLQDQSLVFTFAAGQGK